MTILIPGLQFSELLSAHTINGDDYYVESTNDTSKRAITHCPHCNKAQMPFLHKSLKYIGYSHPWVGVDYQDTKNHYETKCSKCGKPFQFSIVYGG